MGYHSTRDPRLPDEFACFDCRVRADPSWELIKVELYSSVIVKFRELASFRSVKVSFSFMVLMIFSLTDVL